VRLMVGCYRDKLDNRNIPLHLKSRGFSRWSYPRRPKNHSRLCDLVHLTRPSDDQLLSLWNPRVRPPSPSLSLLSSPLPIWILRRRFPIVASTAPTPRRFPIAASTAPAPCRFPIAASTAPAPKRATTAGSWTLCHAPGQSETSSPCSSLDYLLTVTLLVFILGEFFGDYLITLEGGD
jgi:hypothetical protein